MNTSLSIVTGHYFKHVDYLVIFLLIVTTAKIVTQILL